MIQTMNTPLPTNLIELQEELTTFALYHQVKGIRDADSFIVAMKAKHNSFPRRSDDIEGIAYDKGMALGISMTIDWLKTYEAELGARLDRV